MTDVTATYIDNPSFETDNAASDLTGGSTQNTPTGWTISPSSLGNTQWGTANASTKIQGNSTSQDPSAGDNYFYFRDNWQSGTNISVKQDSKIEVPAGNYVIHVDVFTYSSNGTQPVYTFTVSDGTTTYVNGSITANKKAWATYYYHFKLDAAATLTFSANMTPKAAASSKHDWMLLDNFKLLKADNPVEPIANNTTDLYLYNEKEGQYLSSGMNWGTQGICDNYGQELTATLSNGTYTLKTQQYNNKYLGPDFYLDNATAANLLFLETTAGSGKYYITQDGVNYLTSNGAGAALLTNVTTPTDASVWTIVSKADRKAALSGATIDNPGNATFLIADANFSRNVTSSVWNGTSKTSDNKTNLNLAGGNNENMCAESYHATFSINQTLSELHAGVYGLTAQGFYRQDNSGNDNLPYFYLGTEKCTFPLRTGSENSMATASTSFSAGSYITDPIYVRVEANGSLEVGAKLEGENYNLWCIWDNFQLSYYGDVSVAAVKMKASVDAYNAAMGEATAFTEPSMFADAWTALQDAITDNTLDLNDPTLTESALTTATANLVAANTAATAAVNAKTTYDTAVTTIAGETNVDLTSLIVNPSFEVSGLNGWTNVGGMVTQGNTSFGKTGSTYAEYWQPNGTKSLSQTIGLLPAGIYTLTLDAKARGVTSAKLFANTNEVAMTIADDQHTYNLTFEIADKTAINIGFEGVGTGAGASWLAIDNFTLTYVGTINDLTYTLATGKMGTDKSAAQATAESTFLADKTLANYYALLDAISAAEASVANYAALKAAIDKANDVLTNNNFVTDAATTAFEGEIATATTAWNDATYTDNDATAEISVLGCAVSGWHAIGYEGKAGSFMTSAWGKTSENWWNAPYINTWSIEGDNDGSGFSVPFFEYFTDNNQNLGANTFTATLSGLDNGRYEVELWARVQRRSDADFNSNGSMITMSVNGGTAVSIMDNTSNNVGSGTSVMRLGRYKAYGNVTDGTLTLTIDVKLGSNVHWLSWRDVKYTKVPTVTISENDAVAPAAYDFADVTLTRTLKGGQWNGFSVPFGFTVAGSALDGAQVKKFASVTNNEITLENATEIVAGEPYLVKPAADVVNPTFNGVKVTAATDVVKGTGDYKFASHLYNTALATDGSVAYVSTTDSSIKKLTSGSIKGLRAIFNIPTGAAAKALVVDFGEGTTGILNVDAEGNIYEGQIYNLSGQRVNMIQKGIYIVNGKKVLIK